MSNSKKSGGESRASERKARFATSSDIELERTYTESSRDNSEPERPGEFPFTRGIRETMYRGRLWTMRQYAGFGTAAEANERYRYLLSRGSTGLSVAFDLPTQMGRDADHALSSGEVGKVGVSISSVEDMKVLLDSIPLKDVSISMTINSTAAILLSYLLVVAEEQRVDWDLLRGTTQNDVLKEYIARGTYIYPPKAALRITTDLFEFCSKSVPKWNTISISGYHIREAGSNAAQELAFTFGNAIAYVDAAIKKGLEVDSFAPRLAFFFNCHNEFFEEIAKFRAARRIWARIMKERFGAKNPKSLLMRFHTQTAGSSLTAQQPLNNVVRTSFQALAAVLGGTQSLHTNSYDEALGLPTEDSATIALRTQQVLAEETGVADVVDPLGGSYFVESLTSELEARVMEQLELIDRMGGMVAAIENEYPQGEIEKTAYEYQRTLEDNSRQIVGVNAYRDEEENAPPIMKPDPKGELEQRDRLAALRKERDDSAVEKALRDLKQAASAEDNLLPPLVQAARVRATLGECSDVLRDAFGEHTA